MSKIVEKDGSGANRTIKEITTETPGVIETTTHGKGTVTNRNFVNTTEPNITRTTTETPTGGGGQTSTSTKREKVNRGFAIAFSIPITGTVPTNCK